MLWLQVHESSVELREGLTFEWAGGALTAAAVDTRNAWSLFDRTVSLLEPADPLYTGITATVTASVARGAFDPSPQTRYRQRKNSGQVPVGLVLAQDSLSCSRDFEDF